MTRNEARRILLAQLRELLITCIATIEVQVEMQLGLFNE